MDLLKRIVIAIIIGIVTALVVYLIGLLVALLPVVGVVGEFLKNVSGLFGLIAGIYYFVTNKTLVR